jgi:hypothetical protein
MSDARTVIARAAELKAEMDRREAMYPLAGSIVNSDAVNDRIDLFRAIVSALVKVERETTEKITAARLAVVPVPEGVSKITLGPKVRRKLAIQAMDKKWLEIANASDGEGICVRDYLDALYDAAIRAGGRP